MIIVTFLAGQSLCHLFNLCNGSQLTLWFKNSLDTCICRIISNHILGFKVICWFKTSLDMFTKLYQVKKHIRPIVIEKEDELTRF